MEKYLTEKIGARNFNINKAKCTDKGLLYYEVSFEVKSNYMYYVLSCTKSGYYKNFLVEFGNYYNGIKAHNLVLELKMSKYILSLGSGGAMIRASIDKLLNEYINNLKANYEKEGSDYVFSNQYFEDCTLRYFNSLTKTKYTNEEFIASCGALIVKNKSVPSSLISELRSIYSSYDEESREKVHRLVQNAVYLHASPKDIIKMEHDFYGSDAKW